LSAALAAASAVVLATSVLLSQTTVQREVIYTSTLEAPPSGAAPQQADPLEVRAAQIEAHASVRRSMNLALEQVPVVPWNEHGLARVLIAPEAIRFDEARGRYVADLSGDGLAVLTLDPSVQRHLAEVLAAHPEPAEGVAVVDPESGRVLALADDADANEFSSGLARSATAYAASTFKVVTGAALLAEGVATPNTEVCFHGGSSGFELSDLTPDPEADQQCLSLRAAMAWSANLVFARLADRQLDPERLESYAEAFGFNTRIPFEMPLDRSLASIPRDRLGFTRAAAGFHNTWMSPLHGALIQAAIANGGVMMVPTIVDWVEDAAGERSYVHTPTPWRRPIDSAVADALEEVMSETCRRGTARSDFHLREGWPTTIQAWGKTGTLSNRRPDADEDPDPYYVYRWFTGYARSSGRLAAVGALVVNTPRWHIKGTYLASEALLSALR